MARFGGVAAVGLLELGGALEIAGIQEVARLPLTALLAAGALHERSELVAVTVRPDPGLQGRIEKADPPLLLSPVRLPVEEELSQRESVAALVLLVVRQEEVAEVT